MESALGRGDFGRDGSAVRSACFVMGLSTVGFGHLLNLRPDLVDSERLGVNPVSCLMYAAAFFFLFLFRWLLWFMLWFVISKAIKHIKKKWFYNIKIHYILWFFQFSIFFFGGGAANDMFALQYFHGAGGRLPPALPQEIAFSIWFLINHFCGFT